MDSDQDFDQTRCCLVVSVCGYTRSLKKGVIIVCIITMVAASIALVASLVGIATNNFYSEPLSNRPVAGVGLLFGLYCYGVASYQIFVSALLLWTTVKKNGNVYICSLWYISHLSITFGYCIFFIAGFIACFIVQEYVYGVITLLIGILYAGTFSYFCAIVKSYSYMIEEPAYY